ncbi:hypothetical protein [Streptomyces sp. NPDC056987]|uniref:hypothetical protein n=1 Tax=Streptomyces sp. NPDC056987 TaxID=3345988 RepID=UPI00363C13DC
MAGRPGFPHRLTLDLTVEQKETLARAVGETGGSMVDYLRALIELHVHTDDEQKQLDTQLVSRTKEQMRQMRASRRRTRRVRGPNGELMAA